MLFITYSSAASSSSAVPLASSITSVVASFASSAASSSDATLSVASSASVATASNAPIASPSATPASKIPSLASLAQRVLDSRSTPRVAGNIHDMRYRDFWLSLNPDPFVLGVLTDGYRLPFRDGVFPEAYREKNNKTALENLPFLRSHVASLVSDTTVELSLIHI